MSQAKRLNHKRKTILSKHVFSFYVSKEGGYHVTGKILISSHFMCYILFFLLFGCSLNAGFPSSVS